MGKILFITNMENHFIGMKEAVANLAVDISEARNITSQQIDDNEVWDKKWEKQIAESDFILFTWMGTGLCSDFLRKSSQFMQKYDKRHLFNTIQAADDVMDHGILPEQISEIKKYFSLGGLKNYTNLCLWLGYSFSNWQYAFDVPTELPWAAIYHPDAKKAFVNVEEYWEKFCRPDLPTVGFIFAREDWLWNKFDYQDEIIHQMENEGCNIIPVFTNTMADPATGAPGLADNLNKFFYKDGKVIIDVLLNPFVFSLTNTGFLKLEDLRKLGVPILQIVNLYMDFTMLNRILDIQSTNHSVFCRADR